MNFAVRIRISLVFEREDKQENVFLTYLLEPINSAYQSSFSCHFLRLLV
jgi:hypothetical protein